MNKIVENNTVRGTWVQTERKAHEEWARLIRASPRAAELLHLLVANMNKHSAVVISQKVLADLMGVSKDTIKRSVNVLKEGNWVDVVRVGSERGGVNAYVVNRRVAWADKRENQAFASFDARIIVSRDEQDDVLSTDQLKPLPYVGEKQLPSGDGLAPPAQIIPEELMPDLPAVGGEDEVVRRKLESKGQKRLL